MIEIEPGYTFKGGDVVTPHRLNTAVSGQKMTAATDMLLGTTAAEAGEVKRDVGEIPCTGFGREMLTFASDEAAKERLGLDKVDNTPDAEKPVSTDMQEALNTLRDELNTFKTQTLALGEFKMFLHPKEALPSGWFFPDGRWVDLTSELGVALQALPAPLKIAWGVTTNASRIRLFDPDKFFAKDASNNTVGRFPRLAGLGTQQAGTVQADAIRNITGHFDYGGAGNPINGNTHANTEGAFARASGWYDNSSGGGSDSQGTNFDASRVVPTADENRPFNIGVTPGIYLGVTGQPSYVAE